MNNSRIESLESLRGICAVIVLFNHLTVMFYPATLWTNVPTHLPFKLDIMIGSLPCNFWFAGNSSVMVFLVLTGFGSYIVCNQSHERIVAYIFLRWIKLVIPMMLSCFIIWLLRQNDLLFFQEIIPISGTIWFEGESLEYLKLSSILLDVFNECSKWNPTLWPLFNIFLGSLMAVLLSIVFNNQTSKIKYSAYIVALLICYNKGQSIYYCACICGVLIADLYMHNKLGCFKKRGSFLYTIK